MTANLVSGAAGRQAGIFFGDGILRGGILISDLRKRRSEHRSCIERSMTTANGEGLTGGAYYKVYANVVYFPANDLRSQERRLKAFRGTRVPAHNPSNAELQNLVTGGFNSGPAGCS